MAPHAHTEVRRFRPAPPSRFAGSEFACGVCGERRTMASREEPDRSRAWFCSDCTQRSTAGSDRRPRNVGETAAPVPPLR